MSESTKKELFKVIDVTDENNEIVLKEDIEGMAELHDIIAEYLFSMPDRKFVGESYYVDVSDFDIGFTDDFYE